VWLPATWVVRSSRRATRQSIKIYSILFYSLEIGGIVAASGLLVDDTYGIVASWLLDATEDMLLFHPLGF
jgi:hypothetical protein